MYLYLVHSASIFSRMIKSTIMKKVCFILVSIILSSYAYGQEYFERLYSMERLTQSNKHIVADDGSLYFTGMIYNFSYEHFGTVLLLKINPLFEEEWIVVKGEEGEVGYNLTADENYLYIVGEKFVGDTIIGDISIPLSDYSLIKTDYDGNTIFEKSYNSKIGDKGTFVFLKEDTISIFGISTDYENDYIQLIKTDKEGNFISRTTVAEGYLIYKFSVLETADENYIILTVDYDDRITKIRKISRNGTLIWSINNNHECKSIIHANDDGYILVGATERIGNGNHGPYWNNYNIYFSKITLQGDIIWEKTYGEAQDHDYGINVTSTLNDGYIISGNRRINRDDRKINSFLLNIDNSGNTLWYKEFGDGYSSSLNTVSNYKNGYIASGSLFKSNTWYVLLVRTDLNGAIDTSYIPSSIITKDIPPKINLYPNPTDGLCFYNFSGYYNLASISVYSISGQLLKETQAHSNNDFIDLSDMKGSVVIVEFTDAQKKKYRRKLLINN